MAAEGEYPKVDGDILYGSEATAFNKYPLRLLNSSTASTTFTPTKSDSTIVIWVKGQFSQTVASGYLSTTIDLDIASVTQDTVDIKSYGDISNSRDLKVSFALMYSVDDLAAASTAIAVTTSSGSISNLKIIVMEYTKE